MYFFLRIVKFLQLRRRRQIVKSRKYCLMCDYYYFYIFFSIFASHTSENFVDIFSLQNYTDKVEFMLHLISKKE